jgi:hypothetical protein
MKPKQTLPADERARTNTSFVMLDCRLEEALRILALRTTGIWLVSFMDYDLGYIDLEERTLQPLDNPFGPKAM